MEINKLKTFVNLAQTLNFSETAANLYISQSSVSKHIKSLEKEIGHSLFIRSNKNVVLSSYGKIMLPYAQQILNCNKELELKFEQFQAQNNKTIVLGTIPTFSNYAIFQKIMAFNKTNPDINIILKEYETADIYQEVLKGKIDLAFVRSINKLPANFDVIKLKTESFKLYLPDNDSLAKQKVVKIADLKNKTFITLNKNSLLQDPVLQLCREAGFEANITFVSDRVNSILEMVKSKQGVAIMMDSLPAVKGVSVHDISPTIKDELLFIKKKQSNRAPLNSLWNYLKNTIPIRNS